MKKRRSLLRLAALGLLAGSACAGGDEHEHEGEGEGEGEDEIVDADQDGVSPADGDCDDFNNTIHPDARERGHDGVDSNCDTLDQPVYSDDLMATALGVMDTDVDGLISLAEFQAACATSAQVVGEARPGVVLAHAVCAGTNACRGMILHVWAELYEHDCRGVNVCAGWSCVEAAVDQGRTGQEAFENIGCLNCHTGADGAFKVEVPPGADVTQTVATFFDRTDDRFRSSIAFGISGLTPGGIAYSNMPAHYELLSRHEIDLVIAHVRTLELEGAAFEHADEVQPQGDE